MDLVRSWLGQALRATGAAVVVPIAVLLALSLTAVGGSGLGDLGALSQIVSGPRVAGSDVTVDDGDSEIADAVAEIAATPPTAIPGSGAPPPTNGIDEGGGGGGTQPPGSSPPPSAPPGGGPPNDNGGGNGGGGGGGGTPPPGSPPPPEPPDPGVVGGVGETVKDVTAGTPAAPTVEEAVDGLAETCARLGCP